MVVFIYPVEVTFWVELGGTEASTTVSQHSLIFHLDYRELRCYIFFFHNLLFYFGKKLEEITKKLSCAQK